MKMVYTVAEAAEVCGVSYHTIYRRINSGVLKSFRLPDSNQRRIKRQDLMRFIRPLFDPARLRPSGKPKVLAIVDDNEILEAASQAFEGKRWFEFRVIRGTLSFRVGSQIRRWQPDLIIVDSRRQGAQAATMASEIFRDRGLTECRIVHLVEPNDPGLPTRRQHREATLKGPFSPDHLLEAACGQLLWDAPVVDRDYVRLHTPYWKALTTHPSLHDSTPTVSGRGRGRPSSQ